MESDGPSPVLGSYIYCKNLTLAARGTCSESTLSKQETPATSNSDGGEMLQQGMSTDAAGLCAGSSIVFWKNRLKPLRTPTNVEEGLLKKGCAEVRERCRERVGYKVRREEYKDD